MKTKPVELPPLQCFKCKKPKPLINVGGLKLCQECIDKTMGTSSEDKL